MCQFDRPPVTHAAHGSSDELLISHTRTHTRRCFLSNLDCAFWCVCVFLLLFRLLFAAQRGNQARQSQGSGTFTRSHFSPASSGTTSTREARGGGGGGGGEGGGLAHPDQMPELVVQEIVFSLSAISLLLSVHYDLWAGVREGSAGNARLLPSSKGTHISHTHTAVCSNERRGKGAGDARGAAASAVPLLASTWIPISGMPEETSNASPAVCDLFCFFVPFLTARAPFSGASCIPSRWMQLISRRIRPTDGRNVCPRLCVSAEVGNERGREKKERWMGTR